MSSLISRQMAIELIHSMYPSAPIMRIFRKRWEEKYKPYIEVEKALEQLPSVQPEIVRCKDCKYYIPYEWMFDGLSRSSHIEDYSPDEIGCSVNDHNYPSEEYCSYAERREE